MMGPNPTGERSTWREALPAIAPFLYFGSVFYLMTNGNIIHAMTPQWLVNILVFGQLALLLLAIILGFFKGLPRWFLPSFGILLTFCIFLLNSAWLLNRVLPFFINNESPWILKIMAFGLSMWGTLLLASALIVLLSAVWPPLRPFYERVRADWTLLSFCLYGASLVALLLTFDDYINEELYVFLAAASLALGGWGYLRSQHPWSRLLALSAGLTGAMAVAAAGKAILFTSSTWPYPRYNFTWQSEVMSTIALWGWLMLLILAPAILAFLRPTDHNEDGYFDRPGISSGI
jgi:hypothetical protein